MHSPVLLEKYGCGRERLREIFTSTGPSKDAGAVKSNGADGGSSPQENITNRGVETVPYQGGVDDPKASEAKGRKIENWEIRKKFEWRVRSRVLAGIGTGIANCRPLQAVDLAWDAPPIQKETYPLMLWAQGKIKHKNDLAKLLCDSLDPETAAKFVKKDAQGTMMVDIPRICDFSINLVRSYVTRRHAALAALWDNLWPLLKYDPRGTDEVATLVADATTQRIDIMADEYNYRHFLSQCDRDKLLYSQSLIFPRAAWDKQTGIRFKQKPGVLGRIKRFFGAEGETESYVKQEGVDLDNPHPSRWFWDLGGALANINTNNGPRYIGHWGIVPYGTILDGDYWNRSTVVASEAWTQLLQQNSWYFAQYFNSCVLEYPPLAACSDPALMNDRQGNIGLYTSEMRDKGTLLSQYFEKINPKVEGIGDYDAEIWLRLTAAGDGTIVAAEFMPSLPACYGGINVNDNRVANASLAMEMLSFQDMASNIISHMIQQLRISFMMLVLIDKDSLGGEESKLLKELESNAKNLEWWMDPKILTYSASALKELGIMDPRNAFVIIQAQVANTVENAIKSLGQVLSLADRVVNSSPNELGQPNPREVSARESQEQATSVQSIYAFYNEGPREQRGAVKRLVYESLMCHGQDSFEVPVLGRYRQSTIKEAGFELVRKPTAGTPNTLMKSGVRLAGKLRNLDFDYVYTSRDGAERASNTQGAQVLQQMFVGMLQIPGVKEKLGPERTFAMLNVIARMAGAPDEFQIGLDDGEDEAFAEENEGQLAPEVQQAVQKIMEQMQQLAMADERIAGLVTQIAQKVGMPLPNAAPQQGQGAPGAPAAPAAAAAPNGAAAPQAPAAPAGPALLR